MVMPYFGATFTHWSRIDLPNASVPEISAILVSLRFFRSSKIFSQAILSVCGVLNTHFFTGSTIGMPPASEMKGICASSNSGIIAMVVAGRGAADHRFDLVLLDQAGREGARLVGVAAVVIDDELDLLAVDAALLVDLVDIHFQRLLLGIAEEGGGSGHRQQGADLYLRKGDARRADHDKHDGGGGYPLDGKMRT